MRWYSQIYIHIRINMNDTIIDIRRAMIARR